MTAEQEQRLAMALDEVERAAEKWNESDPATTVRLNAARRGVFEEVCGAEDEALERAAHAVAIDEGIESEDDARWMAEIARRIRSLKSKERP